MADDLYWGGDGHCALLSLRVDTLHMADDPDHNPTGTEPPSYLQSFITKRREDGGWLCLHRIPLEICHICTAMLDRRYEILYRRRGPETSDASS